MPRPSTEAEYLARLVPTSQRALSRRTLLRGAVGATRCSRSRRCSPPAVAVRRDDPRGPRPTRRARPAP